MEEYIKIIILAAVSDGEFHEDEIAIIQKLKNSHSQFSNITDAQAHSIVADIYNKISAGMDPKMIIEQMGESLTDEQKLIGYALAKEICVADFTYNEDEKKFIKLLEDLWQIPEDAIEKIEFSLNLRFFSQ